MIECVEVPAGPEVLDVLGRVEAALEALHDSDARMAAVAEQLGSLQSTIRSSRAEAIWLASARL